MELGWNFSVLIQGELRLELERADETLIAMPFSKSKSKLVMQVAQSVLNSEAYMHMDYGDAALHVCMCMHAKLSRPSLLLMYRKVLLNDKLVACLFRFETSMYYRAAPGPLRPRSFLELFCL